MAKRDNRLIGPMPEEDYDAVQQMLNTEYNATQSPFNQGDLAIAQSMGFGPEPGTGEIASFQRQPIGKPEIADAYQTLLKYRQAKASLEERLIQNQKWYTLRHWEYLRQLESKKGKEQVEPTSAWLFNSIANRHASAMDNFPSANILPREEGDKPEAKALSSVIPVILQRCQFRRTYSEVMDDKYESGTGMYGVFWDPNIDHGLGGIIVKSVDLINLFWEPGITDLQDSRNLFFVTVQDNDLLEQQYPQLEGKLGGPTLQLPKYIYDDTIDTSDKSTVVDWYYKVKGAGGQSVLHYCKFVAGQDEPLFATENDPQYTDRGWYDHGQYPFVADRAFRCKGSLAGFGYVDIAKSAQEYIDRGDKAILQNMMANARPRHFIRNDGGVNEEEFADATKDFIHVDGTLGADSIQPVQPNPLSSLYETILANKITELKETTGNRDVTTGGTTSGVTAASAIAAMQEAGSRLDRDGNGGSYQAYNEVIYQVTELIRQFYDTPRWFRILGERGAEEFIQYSNAGIRPQPQGPLVNGVPMEAGVEVGYRIPEFDIEVTAEKQSPYSKVAQNELALQLYSAGFFAPNNADAALVCLDMMDFDRKDFVVQKIEQNGTLLKMLVQTQGLAIQLAQQLDAEHGTNLAEQMAMQFQALTEQALPGSAEPGARAAQSLEALGAEKGESPITANARQRVAESTEPR